MEKVDKKNKRFTRASNEQPNDDFVETLKLIAASNGDSILSLKRGRSLPVEKSSRQSSENPSTW